MIHISLTVDGHLVQYVLIDTHARHATLIPESGHLFGNALRDVEDLAFDAVREHLLLHCFVLDIECDVALVEDFDSHVAVPETLISLPHDVLYLKALKECDRVVKWLRQLRLLLLCQ
jgi:hypothetical protein